MSSSYFTFLDKAHRRDSSQAAQYWQGLLRALPHGHLLDAPSGFSEDATSISLVHATEHFDTIKVSGSLLTAPGCLLSSVYTVPGYVNGGMLRLHNYGLVVFRHKDPSTTLQRIVITIKKPTPIIVTGLSYLALGDYYFELISEEAAEAYPHETAEALQLFGENRKKAESFIQATRARYASRQSFTDYQQAVSYISELNTYTESLPALTFAYFEAVSQCIMLLSQDPTTIAYAKQGEPHNFLYVELMHVLASQQFSRFNAGLFSPSSDELITVLEQGIEQGHFELDPQGFIVATANQLVNLLGGQVCATDEALAGHSLYLWAHKNAPAIMEFLQKRTEAIIQEYWKHNAIDVVYNATTIKGEVGVTAQLSRENFAINLLNETVDPSIYSIGEPVILKIGEHAA